LAAYADAAAGSWPLLAAYADAAAGSWPLLAAVAAAGAGVYVYVHVVSLLFGCRCCCRFVAALTLMSLPLGGRLAASADAAADAAADAYVYVLVVFRDPCREKNVKCPTADAGGCDYLLSERR
jgi:hypothetical protein